MTGSIRTFLRCCKPTLLAACLAPLLFALAISRPAQAIVFESVDGTIEGDWASMTLTIVIKGLTAEQIAEDGPTQAAQIGLVIPKTNETEPILAEESATPPVGFNRNHYLEVLDTTKEELTSEYQYTAKIRVFPNDILSDTKSLEDAKETISGRVVIRVKPVFKLLLNGQITSQQISDKTFVIERVPAVPVEAPTGFSIDAGHKSLTVKWLGGLTVNYNVSSVHRVPSEVLIMVFKPGSESVPLNGKQVTDLETGTTNDVTCTYADVADGEQCISCELESSDTAPVYLSSEAPSDERIQGFYQPSNAATGELSYTVPDLAIGAEYTVVMQYLDATARSECRKATPIRTASLSELNGGEEAKAGDARCFIVSAAYGSPFNRHVDIFRWFRDVYLMPFSWGRAFVDFYYEHSKPFAELVRTSPRLQQAVRATLWLPSVELYGLQSAGEHPDIAWCVLLSVGLLVTSAAWTRRRHRRRFPLC